jgi:hypothetical protein
MCIRYLATVAVGCLVAAPGALAESPAPSRAAAPAVVAPSPPAVKPAHWPKVLPDKAHAKPAVVAPWSQQEIERAQARCAVLLKGLAVVAVPEAPIREGAQCGAAAPMKLVSIGKGPEVALSPPPIVTCDMIATLHRWLERDVQPLARKHLGGPVVRIDAMSSYSCRTAYGRSGGRLSEHGKANALDIGVFTTARGQAAMVVADWGPTARQIAAQAAAAKAEAEKAQAGEAQVKDTQANSDAANQPAAARAAAPSPVILRPGMAVSIPGVTVLMPGLPQDRSPSLGLGPPSHLGGPKPPLAPPAVDGKAEFLRAAHRSACKLFNTVLGPEANNAHKNHFHLDMAERIKDTKICE